MLPVAIVGLSALALVNSQSVFKDVNTDQGPVRGFSIDDDEVFSFYGIPYATAPRGENRFKVKTKYLDIVKTCNFQYSA